MHLLPLSFDVKGCSSYFCRSLTHVRSCSCSFFLLNPANPCIWWFIAPFHRNNLHFFAFDVQLCTGLYSNVFCLNRLCLPSDPDCSIWWICLQHLLLHYPLCHWQHLPTGAIRSVSLIEMLRTSINPWKTAQRKATKEDDIFLRIYRVLIHLTRMQGCLGCPRYPITDLPLTGLLSPRICKAVVLFSHTVVERKQDCCRKTQSMNFPAGIFLYCSAHHFLKYQTFKSLHGPSVMGSLSRWNL